MNLKWLLVVPAVLGFLLAGIALAGPYEDEVEARIGRAGKVCLQGQSCGRGGGSVVSQPAVSTDEPLTTQQIYQKGCAVCHDSGVGGAPLLGSGNSWGNRLQKDRAALLRSVLNGQGAMPPRGVCIDCSDEDIGAALDYMLDSL